MDTQENNSSFVCCSRLHLRSLDQGLPPFPDPQHSGWVAGMEVGVELVRVVAIPCDFAPFRVWLVGERPPFTALIHRHPPMARRHALAWPLRGVGPLGD